MDQFVKEKFETYYREKWGKDPNSFAYDDVIFKIHNNHYAYRFVENAYKIFEAGYDCAKEIYWND